MILVSRRLLKLLTGSFASAITLWPFVILTRRDLKENKVLMNHERIHLRQQTELLLIGFYLWYGLEFLLHFIKKRSREQAYRRISFEREAYAHDRDLGYLKGRRWYAFLKYL